MRRVREDDQLKVSRLTRSAIRGYLSRSAAGVAFCVPGPANGRAIGTFGSSESGGAGTKCRERTAGSTATATLPQRATLGGKGKQVTRIRPWDGRISDEPRADGTICNETRRRAHAKDCRPPLSGGLPTHGLASEAGTRGTLAPHRVDASVATSQRETQCLSPRLYRVPGA